jgi:hypothetical protein
MGAAGWVYCATIFYQNVKGDSALMNAVHLLPCNLLGIVAGVSSFVLRVAGAHVGGLIGTVHRHVSFDPCPGANPHYGQHDHHRVSHTGRLGALTRQGVFGDLRRGVPRCQLLGYGIRGATVAALGHRLVSVLRRRWDGSDSVKPPTDAAPAPCASAMCSLRISSGKTNVRSAAPSSKPRTQ